MSYKLVILVREDLKMSAGKLSSQCSHASVEAVMRSSKKIVNEWRREGMKKIILKVKDEEELMKYKKSAEENKLVTSLITDAGYTEIPKGSITCLGIGPDNEEKIDIITGKLKVL
ncbi:MAG: peptidyl-tRNA hydrolase Pth2 [Nanoarchaeota archaeon]